MQHKFISFVLESLFQRLHEAQFRKAALASPVINEIASNSWTEHVTVSKGV
jgi:hypothetical protein